MMGNIFNNRFLFGESTLNKFHIIIGPWFDNVMVGITFSGTELFYTALIPLIYWCIDKGTAIKTGTIFLSSVLINHLLKDIFHTARPDPHNLLEGIRNLNIKYIPSSPGFPSGHTQGSVAFWGSLMFFVKKKGIIITGILMCFLIPYSRLYLGVHFLGDIIGGYILSILIIIALSPLLNKIENNKYRFNRNLSIPILIILPLAFSLFINETIPAKISGIISGFLIGVLLAEDLIPFNPKSMLKKNILKLFIGFTGIFIIRTGLKLLLPDVHLSDYLRYWVMGLWISLTAPMIFRKLNLVEIDERI